MTIRKGISPFGLDTLFERAYTFGVRFRIGMTESVSIKSDSAPSREHLIEIEKLTDQDIAEIDGMLLSFVSSRWKKIAYVVGRTMAECEHKFREIPDVYFAQRIRGLIDKKILLARGYRENMRYCEVRLKEDESS